MSIGIPTLPCAARCSKCGCSQVHMVYMKPGRTTSEAYLPENALSEVYVRCENTTATVLKECLYNTCRNCSYTWFSDVLASDKEEPIKDTVPESTKKGKVLGCPLEKVDTLLRTQLNIQNQVAVSNTYTDPWKMRDALINNMIGIRAVVEDIRKDLISEDVKF